ncbi:MAG: hypothetical protein FJ303_24530 [Planctomycetes bacterium]|nr:hypothetical protein [Planctomycetota bacterium]
MAAAKETILQLAEQIRRCETSSRPGEPARIPLGVSGLDTLFPQRGLSTGSLVELLPRMSGAGAWTLALLLARYACGDRKTLLIADAERCFYPPATCRFGFDPEHMIIVRPRTSSQALLALAQALRCPVIGAALGAFDTLTDRDGRRLQLAAESGGTLGILIRPITALAAPSFAATRLMIDPLPSEPQSEPPALAGGGRRRRMRLESVRCRGGQEGKTVCLEIEPITCHARAVPITSQAASAALGSVRA